MTMAAGRKNTAPKRRATTARGGRPSGKSGPPKGAGPVRPKTPTRKVAQTATPGRLLAAAQEIAPNHAAQHPRAIDHHYLDLRRAMKGVFHELGIAA